MRTPTTREAKLLELGSYATHFRVLIADVTGTVYQDLTDLDGLDFVQTVKLSESVDDPYASATIELTQSIEKFSVAPLITTSKPNTIGGSYAPLLDLGRLIVVETQMTPEDQPPDAGAWVERFRGYVDIYDDSSDDKIVLTCKDLGARIRDTQIEIERAYGVRNVVGTAPRIFGNDEAYALGEFVVPSILNGFVYEVTTAGTTDATPEKEPDWTQSIGALVTSGSVVFTCAEAEHVGGVQLEQVINQILFDNGLGWISVYAPTPSTFLIRPYKSDRKMVGESLQQLVDLIGWVLRFRFDEGTGQWRLTLFAPDRAITTPMRTFSPDDVDDVARSTLDRAWIRNRVVVIWHDPTDLDPAGDPRRKVFAIEDAASVARFHRRTIELLEGTTSQINDLAKVSALATSVLSDLKDPAIELSVILPYAQHAELCDFYRFSADHVRFSADQDLAVFSIEHSFDGISETTTLGVRGKPSGGYERWHRVAVTPGKAGGESHSLKYFVPTDVLIRQVAIPGAVSINVGEFNPKGPKQHYDGAEFYARHLSLTMGGEGPFDPVADDLVARMRGSQATMLGLRPGETYSLRVAPTGMNEGRKIRALAHGFEQITIPRLAPDYTEAKHWRGEVQNGNFLGAWPTDGNDSDPSHWTLSSGSGYGSDVAFSTAVALSANRSIMFRGDLGAVPAGKLTSSRISVVEGETLGVSIRYRNSSTSGAHRAYLGINWYTQAGTFISTDSVAITAPTANAWHRYALPRTAPATARYAEVVVGKNDGAAFYLYLDSVECVRSFDAWQLPALGSSWVSFDGFHNAAAFRLHDPKTLEIRGLIRSGLAGVATSIFALPLGYRPLRHQVFACDSNGGGIADLRIRADTGVVRVEGYASGGSNAWVSLDGIFVSLD